MNDNTKDFITAIGAVAEICGELYRQLGHSGFQHDDAMELVKTYLTWILNHNGKDE